MVQNVVHVSSFHLWYNMSHMCVCMVQSVAHVWYKMWYSEFFSMAYVWYKITCEIVTALVSGGLTSLWAPPQVRPGVQWL